ncbi:MAG TPA: hypothetical protein PKK56_01575 [archaeon]|jgi:hypothetical protein|nr:hypothetical protein [archaeon]
MNKKQAFSTPFTLVYENKYPILGIGPGFYKNYIDAKTASPDKWVKKDEQTIIEQSKKQIFTIKNFKKTETLTKDVTIENIQLLSQTYKTTEIEFDSGNKTKIINDEITGINNYSFDLNKLKIIDNLKIPKIIDKTVNDIDLKAQEGILNIYNKLDNVYKIQQLLSVGLLGEKQNRVFVPTKWSITAVDDIIGKKNIENIKINQEINKPELYIFQFYKNKFYIIILPYKEWAFEMIENQGDKYLDIDYEIGAPRKQYATSVGGGYYAARIEISKALEKRKKIGKVLVLRDILPEYKSPGVWVIREAIKEAMNKKPLIFEDLESIKKYLDNVENIRHKSEWWFNKSNILKDIKNQKRIFEYY